MFCLFGCKEQVTRTYLYCLVDACGRQMVHGESLWVAHCDGDGTVVLPRSVNKGDGIYYTPYYENDDAVTTYGYLHSIDEVTP